MAMEPDSEQQEEFFDCITDVKYCAIASPKGQGAGEVFVDFSKARAKWKQLKGSRMKIFDNYGEAQTFANTPIEQATHENAYPPSPKADVEATPFSSVPQGLLVKFRSFIERGDLDNIRTAIQDNPMCLVTASDTPTLLQIRLRYNALHVAAAAGNADTIELLLSYLNSPDFWRRIYPGTDGATARDRQRHVTDLYLNSPELGNLETPLHFASKFGHITCVRLLAVHPLTQINVLNRAGQTPADLAASRMSEITRSNGPVNMDTPGCPARSVLVSHPIRRLLSEHFILLVDVRNTRLPGEQKITILPPISSHQFQSLLTLMPSAPTPRLLSLFPFLPVERSHLQTSTNESNNHNVQLDLDLIHLGLDFHLLALRGFAGPMTREEAEVFRSRWLKTNSSTSFKTFASVRLTDPEKGYERQGRHLSRISGVQWHEYWPLMNDYLDLASEQGLAILENYMKQYPSPFKLPSCQSVMLSNGSTPHKKNGAIGATEEPGDHSPEPSSGPLNFDEPVHSTPIRRQRVSSPDHPVTSVKQDPWMSYRSNACATNVLNDSLEGSNDDSEIHVPLHDSEDGQQVNSVTSTIHLSPILSLLQRLTFASPLRWLLIDSPGGREPLFNPESPLPDHKKLVKVHSPHINSGTSPGKRRMSAIDPDATKSDDQPLSKKPSPKKLHEANNFNRIKVPLYLKHIYRALPAGDPELETAVTVLSCAEQSTVAPTYSRIPNMSRFPIVATWKKQIEAVLPSSQNPGNR
ncbi:Ankyrin repeat and LEM domain-containing protein 2 [Clonorchis sinensis]|uniref:Ankyrin repeat and LEM domain-containing protein 2 n=1 Tax=Clonorchis sinensis TaxID=79923 RepID=A0A8T1MKC2_CLOSI|nr:Ankyrin repeat and LEM domain-containing protein 2 [Clonorchis sinensis]